MSTPAKAERKSRVLIVDDHPLVREGLAMRIEREPDLEVCGQAADTEAALELVRKHSPDLVIVDISLRRGHGIDLIERVHALNARVRMLVASMHDESRYAERALRAGASGYVNKQEAPEVIVDAIRAVLRGRVYVSPQLSDALMRRATGGAPAGAGTGIDKLSNRELQVFELLGRGMTLREIAQDLGLSVRTVETHREHIRAKLALRNNAELARASVSWVLDRA